MKAIFYTEYGPPEVLHIREVEKPIPKDNEILIRVYAVSVTYGEILARKFGKVSPKGFNMPLLFWLFARLHFGWKKPKKGITGSEFSGEIEAVGTAVKQFEVGDEVFGYLGIKMGANAEYLCMPENGAVAIKPKNISFEEAATIPYGTLMALELLRKVNVQSGQKVLINGASGGIGSAAVQLAKYHFNAEVTGVCGTPRVAFVKALGADKVIDYTKDDFTQTGESYDLVFDILGKSSFSKCKNSLKPNGIYFLVSFKTKQLMQMLWTKMTSKKRVVCALAVEKKENLILIKELIEAEKIKSIIDKSFSMEEAVEAHRYAESGNKKGHIVINMK